MTLAIPYQLRDDLYRRPLAVALDRLGDMTNFTCVDVGAGGGDVSVALAELCGAKGRVYAVDIDPIRRNQIAAKAAKFSQVIAITQAVEDLVLPEMVDLAFSRFLLLAVPNPRVAIARMLSVVKAGGWIIAQEPITSAGRVGRSPIQMDVDDVLDPDIGTQLIQMIHEAGAEIRDSWVESPAGFGKGAVASYLEALTGVETIDEQIVLPPLVTVVAKI